MNSFIFANPTKVYFGKDQLVHLGEEVSRFGKKVLLAYGGGSIKRIGLYDKVTAELAKAGMTVFELAGVEPNPHHTTVNNGAEICKREGVDVILAGHDGDRIARVFQVFLGFIRGHVFQKIAAGKRDDEQIQQKDGCEK